MFGFSLRPRKANTARVAKDRLQILLAHERSGGGATPDRLPLLQREILEVIKRHMQIDNEAVDIRMERGDELSRLEINIDLPSSPTQPSEVHR